MARPQINKSSDGDTGFVAFYNGKEAEVYANTSLQARDLAVTFFKPPKSKKHMVHVMVAERNGAPVVHSTASI